MKTLALIAVVSLCSVPLLSAATVTAQQQSRAATKVCTLKVTGMTCGGCEAAVRMAARSVDGVTEVKASYAKHNAEVTYDPAKTAPDAIAKVITEKSGFKTEPDRWTPPQQK